jgi:2-polyprenyl-3-methyl-5-hydroxy-6-metoxy-1,4-benzoquinol methylase
MAIQRVAVIFDDTARPETTGVYCRTALANLVEVVYFRPSRLAHVPRQGFDLYLQIDDGLEYRHPPGLRPCAWWAIDTHLDFDRCLAKARDFDVVFAAQRDGADRLRQHGIPTATWLPLACDPVRHGQQRCEKKYDLSFVGHIFPGPRAELLELLQKKFPKMFIGQCYFEEMAKTYSASRIVFNRSIRNDINMRVFEALASGSLLLTNDLAENGQVVLFQDGVHLATYRDPEELLDKARFYLQRAESRERIAAAGRNEVLARHTYRHRMEQILAVVEKALAHSYSPGSVGARTAAISPEGADDNERGGPDPSYFEFARTELLALIPESARKVLDIGCGAGWLGEAIKKRQPAEVVGIEFVEAAARRAEQRLDRVLAGDIEHLEPDFTPGSFDAVVCGDVLEHLRDPARMLHRIRTWLQPDGLLIASIPNVRHHTVVRGLLAGNWTYESAGLLDRTHLRFFTRREIEKLFFRTGFGIRDLQMVAGPGDEGWEEQAQSGTVKVGCLHMAGMPPEEAAEFYVYQYLLTAVPAPRGEYGLTSIVILTHNQLDYTRQCLDSIRQYTDEPYELIVVDNASSDGTVDYLLSLGGIKVIANKENRGFPAAANQGIQTATGRTTRADGVRHDRALPVRQRRRQRGFHGSPPPQSLSQSPLPAL